MTDTEQRLWDPISGYLQAEGVELDDVEVAGAGRGAVVRITVDAPGGLDVERIAELSRGLSRILDDADVITDSYSMEVSSPGLERKLRRPEHWRKSVGREVKVKTAKPVAGGRTLTGIVRDVTDAAVAIERDSGVETVAFGDVVSAKTIFRWEKATKPGGER